ncbi:ABC transporter ATP-binding protein [Sediminispirochaeta smaragdinae]|uniref:ABC transporter related protein n=1 Tax=Sediminispirochaeta smaragdinae (strain DSM 11293 / JCM 15392 / SEBR 4228) TaxID=573413 RepID=E1R9Q8_SEDSS|nr:ABC transporter ATP-binding protein [Sediminispirochaeta smaragdinae]ADK83227.1 ABC transporter related protein [Sediminispirochaeta smaragdinae DSM 11293]
MLKRFISYYRPHWALFIIDMAAATVMAGLSILFPYLTRELLRTYIPQRNSALIFQTFVIMVTIYLVNLGLNYIRIKWGHILGVRMETDMRRELFRHLQKLSFSYYDRVKTGHIMSRISNDLNMITEVAHHAPEDLLISIVVLIGAYFFMFFFSVPLALISLIPLPLMLVWGIFMGGKMRGGFRMVRKEVAEINSTVENAVQGIREVQAFTNEWLEEEKFRVSNDNFKQAKSQAYTQMARFHSVMNFLRDMYYLTVVGGGALLILQGVIEVYDLLSFVLFVGIVLPPIDRLINFNEQLQQGSASFERFIEIMDIEPDIVDKKGARPLSGNRLPICYDSVSFRYQKETGEVLSQVNLNIPAGGTVAVVGESGAGKSTLVTLLPRFYEPTGGRILIGGQDICDVTRVSLREKIGIVQQNVFLFDATIRENIMYGNHDAGEERMREAAASANILSFIESLPEGFDTEVGERGVLLSGGQKQRISIARVFLKNPPILIFDEATSSLDNESEAMIQEAMFRLSKDRTTIIIAHRLSTVRNVDTIHVMRAGKIVESGSHDELLVRKGYYASLYRRHAF